MAPSEDEAGPASAPDFQFGVAPALDTQQSAMASAGTGPGSGG